MTDAVVLAVGAIVIADGALLLVRRGRAPGVGKWSIPGGRVEVGERMRDAVVREIREETGIDISVGEFAGWVERTGSDEGFHFVIIDFFATPVAARVEPRAGDDADDTRWVPLAEVPGYDLVDGLLDFLRSVGSLPEWP